MVTALVLMNVERAAVNSTAQELLTIPGVERGLFGDGRI